MKKLSKLLALLLALAMVFCLVACSAAVTNNGDKNDADFSDVIDENAPDAEKILGKWTYRWDTSDFFAAMFAQLSDGDLTAPDTAVYANITLEFDDETFTMTVEYDMDSLEDWLDDFVDCVVDYAKEQGKEEQLEQEYGMPLEEYLHEQLEENLDGYLSQTENEAIYYYKMDEEEGYIYYDEDEDELDSEEEAMIYSFKGSKLMLTGSITDGEEAEIPDFFGLPWKFEKE